jgi:hypothetical protein
LQVLLSLMEKFWSLKAATPLKSCYQVRSMNTMVDETRSA